MASASPTGKTSYQNINRFSNKRCFEKNLDCKRIILISIFAATILCIFYYSVYLNSNSQNHLLDFLKFNKSLSVLGVSRDETEKVGTTKYLAKASTFANNQYMDNTNTENPNYVEMPVEKDLARETNSESSEKDVHLNQSEHQMINTSKTNSNIFVGCNIPFLNPFDSSVMEFINEPEPINCTEHFPFIFYTDVNLRLLRVAPPEDFGYTECCYRYLIRSNKSDNSVSLSIDCFPMQNATEIPPEHEFIAIACKTMKKPVRTKVVDILGFVPEKKYDAARENKLKQTNDLEDTLNVVILGVDGLSHMNFIRLLSKTHNYLTKNLSALEMQGYTKVGDNTYPNIVPVLSSFTEEELVPVCLTEDEVPIPTSTETLYSKRRPRHQFYDRCPFLWKNFSENGFLTSYAEDAPWIGIFNYEKKGFQYPPTDYYIRPMTYFQEKIIGNHRALNVDYCYGPRLSLGILLDYMQKTAATMKQARRKYFQFIWATALFHDSLTDGKHGDGVMHSNLKWFHQNNYLNNTALIVMSDHGVRFGEIRYTYQGKIEERMPLLYIVLPEWFQMKYKTAGTNIKENQRKLSTPFDLHETLKDLLNPGETIREDVLSQRSSKIDEMINSGVNISRGISLFLPIPASRTCEMAEIDDHWCICQKIRNLDLNIPVVKQAASTAVYFINKLLEPFQECAFLSLNSILNAQIIEATSSILNSNNTEKNFGVTFLTDPGKGAFEATINVNQEGKWSMAGDVSRINLYGNQSHCVHSYKLKKYCYCLDASEPIMKESDNIS